MSFPPAKQDSCNWPPSLFGGVHHSNGDGHDRCPFSHKCTAKVANNNLSETFLFLAPNDLAPVKPGEKQWLLM